MSVIIPSFECKLISMSVGSRPSIDTSINPTQREYIAYRIHQSLQSVLSAIALDDVGVNEANTVPVG